MNRPRNSALAPATTWTRSRTFGRLLAAAAGALSLVAAAACTNAVGNIQGGQYILPVIDAGVVETSAPPIPDLVLSANCSDGGPNAGIRWQDLYECYFGPSGVASCAGSVGNCHGESDGTGAQASGFNCPVGDAAGCLSGMAGFPLFSPGQAPADTTLFGVLRQSRDNSCSFAACMPLMPPVVFGPDDMARIGAWIDAGSPNN